MELKTLDSIDLSGKTILYRAPYDIDVVEKGGKLEVADDSRIRATLPTLKYLIDKNCKITILTWVGRPDGQVVEKLRTVPHAEKLSELLGRPVQQAGDCVGPEVAERTAALRPGEILMLENVRFHKEETDDDDSFAAELCRGKDLIVFDGFPQAMRVHASTTGILRHLPAIAGSYFESEITALSNLLEDPARPFTVIIGGSKISDKVDAVNNLLPKADKVLVAGAVANVFLRALGRGLGSSFVEDVFVDSKRREKKDWVEYAAEMLAKYKDKIVYPSEVVISDGQEIKTINILEEDCPEGFSVFDIGPATIKDYSGIITSSGTVFMAGPIGKYEDERFSGGSRAIIAAMSENKGSTIIAGGNTIDMARRFGDLSHYSHVSLAAGATLDFLAGKELPVLPSLVK